MTRGPAACGGRDGAGGSPGGWQGPGRGQAGPGRARQGQAGPARARAGRAAAGRDAAPADASLPALGALLRLAWERDPRRYDAAVLDPERSPLARQAAAACASGAPEDVARLLVVMRAHALLLVPGHTRWHERRPGQGDPHLWRPWRGGGLDEALRSDIAFRVEEEAAAAAAAGRGGTDAVRALEATSRRLRGSAAFRAKVRRACEAAFVDGRAVRRTLLAWRARRLEPAPAAVAGGDVARAYWGVLPTLRIMRSYIADDVGMWLGDAAAKAALVSAGWDVGRAGRATVYLGWRTAAAPALPASPHKPAEAAG